MSRVPLKEKRLSMKRKAYGRDSGLRLRMVLTSFVLGLIYVLHEGPVHGWTEPATVIGLIGGILAALAFVVWELRQVAPLLDVRLFGERGLASGSVSLLAVFGVQAGIFVVLFPFLQAVLGWSALRATLPMMPMALLMMLASGLAPQIAARIGARATMATGILLGGVGLALMASLVSVEGGYLAVLPGMLAMGLGMGLSMTPSTEAITGSLPRERQGVASALSDGDKRKARRSGSGSIGIRFCASWWRSSTSATTPRSAAARSASAATSSRSCRRTRSTPCGSDCSATRSTSSPGSTR